MYELIIKPTADKAFKKLVKKDKEQLKRINAKIKQILENPYHFKPLRKPQDGYRRAHIGSFVIIFEINEDHRTVSIYDYEHHDKIYKLIYVPKNRFLIFQGKNYIQKKTM